MNVSAGRFAQPSSNADYPRRGLYPWLRRAATIAWCAIVFAGCFHFYTLHNDFPIDFHPDESGKVEQLLSGERNFNHPQLMLEASELGMRWTNARQDPESALRLGRDVSALLAAIAVLGFTIAGYFSAGLTGMVLVSLTVGLCPSLLVYAHFMKEEPALLGGMGVCMAGMAIVWHRQRPLGQLFGTMLAGIGVGLAASGKYVGAMALVGALLATLFAKPRVWHWRALCVGLLLACSVLAWAAINHRVFEDWQGFEAAFTHEYEHGTSGHYSVSMARPNTFPFYVLNLETQPHIKLFALAFLLAFALIRSDRGWRASLLLFFASCAAVLSYGAIPFHRYELPLVVLMHFLAGLGAAAWLHLLIGRPRWWAASALAAAGLSVAAQGIRCNDILAQFVNDSRYRVKSWIDANVPSGTRYVGDAYAMVRLAYDQSDPAGGSRGFASQYGTLEDLRQNGIGFVIVCDANFYRYTIPQTVERKASGYYLPSPENNVFAKDKAWYERLFREGKLVWTSAADGSYPTRSFLNPEIRIYDIRK